MSGSPTTAYPALFTAGDTKITIKSEADGKLCVTNQAGTTSRSPCPAIMPDDVINSKEAKDRAKASFRKKEDRAGEAVSAMKDYEREQRVGREVNNDRP